MIRFKILFLLFSILLLQSAAYAAEQKKELPLWELGLIAGGASIPHYVGSNQRYALPLVLPYFIYRGEKLRADRKGIRGRLFETDRLSMDLDFSFGLPVRNSNRARQGMPNLHLAGQAGPQLNWALLKDTRTKLGLHLPWRIAMDTRGTSLGWVFEPGLRLNYNFDEDGDYKLDIEASVLYASKRYNQYYYSVTPQYATAIRPAYDAKRGLHSVSLKTGLLFRQNSDVRGSIFLTTKTLSPGVVANSPLVKSKYYISIGAGITWMFMTSKETVLR